MFFRADDELAAVACSSLCNGGLRGTRSFFPGLGVEHEIGLYFATLLLCVFSAQGFWVVVLSLGTVQL